MCRPTPDMRLQLYLSVSNDVISVTLVQENLEQRLIHFISRVLQDSETRYQLVEKIALALLCGFTCSRQPLCYAQEEQDQISTLCLVLR